MGRQSRTRRYKHASRIASAVAVGRYWFGQGAEHEPTIAHLESLPEPRLLDVQQHALACYQMPGHKDYNAACMTLGALARVVQKRQQDEAVSG